MLKTLLALCVCLPLIALAQEAPASSPVSAPTSAPASEPATELAAVCGNGVREPGEACDDGNLSDTDECSSRCEVIFASPKKSKALAFALSAGLSAGGIALFFVDTNGADQDGSLGPVIGSLLLVVAPSAGHLYAGDVRHALVFSGLRVASNGVFVLGVGLLLTSLFDDGNAGLGLLSILGGGLATGGLILYDVIDAPRSVGRVEARKLMLQQKKTSLSLLPAPLKTQAGGLAPGLTLGLRF